MKIRKELLYIASIVLAYALKASYFYISTDMPLDKLIYGLVTVSVFSAILFLFHRKPKIYIALSILLTVIMFGDLLYYRYFMGFLSIKLIQQATFVGSVTSIIFSIVKITDVILFIDLFLFLGMKKRIGRVVIYKRKSAILLTIIILPSIILGISFSEIYTGIKKYEFFNYHIFDIISTDFENNQLGSGDRKFVLEQMDERTDLGIESKHFGVAEDRNLILVQVESLQNDFIGKFYEGQEILPNLNALIQYDSIYFSNYYQQLGKGNTSDAEFVTLNSVYPITTGNAYNVYEKNDFYGLPWIMKEHGYTATSYHGYESSFWNRENIYPYLGFDQSYFEDDYVMGEKIVFGLDDQDFFNQSIPLMKGIEGKRFDFMVTLSSHKPFVLPENKISLILNEEDQNYFGSYVQSINYVDGVIGSFIDDLKSEGLYDDSIIVFYGDHYGIGVENEEAIDSLENFIGRDYTHEDMMNIPLIVHIPGLGSSETYDISGGQVDLLPTLLNLMGIRNEYLTFGRDLINNEVGFVASQTFMEKGSFIDNNIVFEISRDGVFENSIAYDRDTHEPVDIELCREGYEHAIYMVDLSKKITESDSIVQIINEFNYGSGQYLKE
ncbi:MAG: LTA synthase family protein [Bacillota bacterium]|nr:LTA synthase family protein [Bacillota bacterium]